MFQGNWKCSGCGGAITELPFEPRGEAGLTCRTCYSKQKDGEQTQGNGAGVPHDGTVGATAPDMSDIPEDASVAGEQPPAPDFEEMAPASSEKPKFAGDWKCAGCGGPITSLPFEPRGKVDNLKCIDCFRNSKNS